MPANCGKTSYGSLESHDRGAHDRQKVVHLEAGAAYESAAHVRLVHERACVVRFHTAAILNRKGLGGILAELFRNSRANEGVGVLSLLGSGVASRADGPHRFIGDGQPGEYTRLNVC